VKKKECPVCDSSDLTETKGGKFTYESGRKIEVSFLKCNQCGTDLRLTK
jgi:ssDNA-binding Zn-finger/Zn-ribbon topoisomerase 1